MKKRSITAFMLSFGLLLPLISPSLQILEATEQNWQEVEYQAVLERQNITAMIGMAQQDLANQQALYDQKQNELEDLRKNGKVLEQEYSLLEKQLKRARHAMKASYALYDHSLQELGKKQKQYKARMRASFEAGKPSVLSILLNSSNLKGFFHGIELSRVVADSDLEIIEQLKNARDMAQLAKENAEKTNAKSSTFIEQIEKKLGDLKNGIRLGEDELYQLQLAVADRNRGLSELQYQGAVVDANIRKARDEIAYQATLTELNKQQNIDVGVKEKDSPFVDIKDVEVTTVTVNSTESQSEETITGENSESADLGTNDSSTDNTEVLPEETPSPVEVPTEDINQESPQEVTTTSTMSEDSSTSETSSQTEAEEQTTTTTTTTETSETTEETSAYDDTMFFPNGYSQTVTSPYGSRTDPFTGFTDFHLGCDFQGDFGSPIYAALDGVVTEAVFGAGQGVPTGGYGSYGNYIVITHPNGWKTRYAHLQYIHVSVGQQVGKGELIGGCGSTGRATGPHLHFEVIIGGATVNPLPYLYK